MAAIALLAILQFCLFLNHKDITNAHEGRTAATAREMLQRHEWIVPYCNGAPRLAKPPLMYWAADLVWTITGKIDVWSARFPAALCGALAVLFMMDLARRTLGRNACLFAGLVWISTWFIVTEYRKAMADPYLAFFTLLAIWAWIAADQSRDRRWARALILISYLAAAGAALAKVHLIIVHMALALVPYHLLRRRAPRMLKTHAVGAVLFLLIAAAWPLYIFMTIPNAWPIWRADVLASEATSGQKFSPVYDYIIALPTTAAPWTLFAIVGALLPLLNKTRHDRRALWPLVWLAATILVFSCLPMKKDAYLLPALPAQTLLVVAGLLAVARMRTNWDRILLDAHLAAAVIALAALLFWPQARWLVATLLVLALAALFVVRWRGSASRTIILTALVFAATVHIIESWLTPAHLNQTSDASFAQNIRQQIGDDQPLEVIGPGPREDIVYYLGGRIIPRVASIDQLPADYHGFAIVSVDQIDQVRASPRAQQLAVSPDRSSKIYFFRITQAH